MIQANYNWDGDAAYEYVVEAGWEGLQRAVVYFWNAVTQALNVSAGPYTRVRTRDTSQGGKGSTYTAYRDPSKPGEIPRKRTGFGQANTIYELDRPTLTGRVGVLKNAFYMIIHETGLRPWLLKTLDKNLDQIAEQTRP